MPVTKWKPPRAMVSIVGWLCLLGVQNPPAARAQQASISTWTAADFRVWGFVPYWTPQSQLNGFPADGVYDHVSDVLYFSGVRPTADGSLNYHPSAAAHLNALKSHAAQFGFRFHMSMFDTAGGSVETVWNSITANAANRANFVENVKNLLLANEMTGFNLDWERPNTVAEWANYTQLAKDLRAAFDDQDLDFEISVDDYGFADARWDDSPVFDARTYDQLFIMGYHYGASSYVTFADGKLNLDDQGARKAFQDEQLVLGMGTWGDNGPGTVALKDIVAVDPDLPADALTFTGTVPTINGTPRTGTWDIESRYQVREKTQLALDRNMAGMMSWTLHYDAAGALSLHRVVHHYLVFQRGVPDLNLDGRVDADDANTLADNMGSVPGWTGTNTPARFEDFYISGNWEKGDHDGNGFVNQADADWLAGRYAGLGVNVPDRLPYTGTFDSFQNSQGINGRWRAIRDGGKIREAGNYTQHAGNQLSFTGTGPGADKHSSSAVTIRNQNGAEAYDTLNTLPRVMQADLATPIDLGAGEDTYFTFLVRQNTASLLASQRASGARTLSLDFLDADGDAQLDFSFFGKQEEFAIGSQADAAGENATSGGFAPDTTYMVVGRLSGNGAEANTLQASLFANGSEVGRFTNADFEWMLTAGSSADFNPVLTSVGFTSLYEANYTVSNLWIGAAEAFFDPAPSDVGDFNGDGRVDAADYVAWRDGLGMTYSHAHYQLWRANFSSVLSGSAEGTGSLQQQLSPVPEPATAWMAICLACFLFWRI